MLSNWEKQHLQTQNLDVKTSLSCIHTSVQHYHITMVLFCYWYIQCWNYWNVHHKLQDSVRWTRQVNSIVTVLHQYQQNCNVKMHQLYVTERKRKNTPIQH